MELGDLERPDVFRGTVEPVRPSRSFRVALAVGALTLALALAVYLGVLGAVAYGLYRLAAATPPEALALGPVVAPRIVLQAGSPVLFLFGSIFLLFMTKPLFISARSGETVIRLVREANPLLFDFVERVARSVGSPTPKELRVDLAVNASVQFRRGALGLLLNDIVLTVGLPLIARLDLRELAGVLAHELGHYNQVAGLRLSWVLMSVDGWLTRVVWQRDRWDASLTRLASSGLALWSLTAVPRLSVWATRWLLWAVTLLARLVCAHLLRHMELDADRYQARLVGCPTAERVLWGIYELDVAAQRVEGDLARYASEGRLVDDLPTLVAFEAQALTPRAREELERVVLRRRTGFLDSHPAARERLASLRREAAEGIFASKEPATALFRDFSSFARAVSLEHYRDLFGPRIKPEDLSPVEDLLRQRQELEADLLSLRCYLQYEPSPLRPLPLRARELTRPAGRASPTVVKRLRQETAETAERYRPVYERYLELDRRSLELAVAITCLEYGQPVDVELLRLSSPTVAAARAAQERTRGELTEAGRQLADLEEAAARRLELTLRLLKLPDVVAALEEGEATARQAEELYGHAARAGRYLPRLRELRADYYGLGELVARLGRARGVDARLLAALAQRMQELRRRLLTVRKELGAAPYPLDHAREGATLCDHVLPVIPVEEDLQGLARACEMLFDRFGVVYVRLLGRLAAFAERVEDEVLKLAPLADPTPDADDEPEPTPSDPGFRWTIGRGVVASNPAGLAVHPFTWVRHYPRWPLTWGGALVACVALGLGAHWGFLVAGASLLLANVYYWVGVREHFLHGDLNPAVVLSLRPMLIAVGTDLTLGDGAFPVVKVLKKRLRRVAGRRPEVGTRLAAVSLYARSAESDLPASRWADFDPRPAATATPHPEEEARLVDAIPQAEWDELERHVARLPEPRRAGLYRVDW